MKLKFSAAQRLSHAYIISADDAGGMAYARNIASAAVCSGQGERPCGVCRDCRKAMANIHPDVVTLHRIIDDKGKEKRNYVVDQVRDLIADTYVMPNEAQRKVYIIPQAETMNAEAQNAALKLLEEPPRGVVLLLCTSNPQMLLPTVRSRCAEICTHGEVKAEDNAVRVLSREFIKTVASGDRASIFKWCAANDAMEPRAAVGFIDDAYELSADMLCGRENACGMTRESVAHLNALLGKCGAYLKVNTGVKHIFGLLAVRACSAGEEERILN